MQAIVSVALFLLCLLFATFYIILGREKTTPLALSAKGFASLCFFALGLLNYLVSPPSLFSTLMVLGLAFGAVADIVFGARHLSHKYQMLCFCAGVGLFAVGHVFYILAFHTLGNISPLWYAVAVVFGTLVYALPRRYLGAHYGRLNIIVLCYAVVISLMLFCAIAVAIPAPIGYRGLLVCAALLFSVSDFILLHMTFIKSAFVLNVANLSTYYLAQLMFAMAIRSTM